MSFEAIKKQEQEYILHSYGRVDVALSHGKNAEAWDVEGKHYYDFTSGIGVNALGYCDEDWVKAVTEQAGKIQHMSNYYYCDKNTQLAELLAKNSGLCRSFFCNSWKILFTAERLPHWRQRVRTAFIGFSPR